MLIKATANQASITQALANAKNGDGIYVSGGTCLMDGAFKADLAASNARLICDGDVTIRCILYPLAVATKVCQRIKAMATLGLSGDYRDLSPTDKTRVDAALPGDASDVQAIVNTFMATLKPWQDSRMFGAPIKRTGDITYQGKSFQWGINWGSKIAKGILNCKDGAFKQAVENFTWENGRQEGSSYNGTGVYVASAGVIVRRNTFRDCEDGVRSSDMLVPNPKGQWYFQHLSKGRADLYGYIASLYNTYDNCGAGGNAHGFYAGQALWSLSAHDRVIRTNFGIGLKFHGDGVSVCYAPTVDDASDTMGIMQAVDFDCGPCYVVNGVLTKATAGGGNYQAPVLFRNDREPIPSWSEPRGVAIGNVITYALNHSNIAFVRALNASAYFGDGQGHDMWPGVPVPMTGLVRNNVFRTANPVGHTQTQVPANFVIDGNVLIDLNAPIPDLKVQTSNYAFSDASLLDDFADIVCKSEGSTPAWLTTLIAQPVFPSSFTPLPSPAPVPAPAPQPTPEEIDMGLYQDRALAAEAEVTRLNGVVSQMQLDAIAAATKFKGAMDQKDQAVADATAKASQAQQEADAANNRADAAEGRASTFKAAWAAL